MEEIAEPVHASTREDCNGYFGITRSGPPPDIANRADFGKRNLKRNLTIPCCRREAMDRPDLKSLRDPEELSLANVPLASRGMNSGLNRCLEALRVLSRSPEPEPTRLITAELRIDEFLKLGKSDPCRTAGVAGDTRKRDRSRGELWTAGRGFILAKDKKFY